MRRRPRTAPACLALALMLAAPAVGQEGAVRGVHDPCLVREGDAYTILATGGGLAIRRSTDLLRWGRAGVVFPDGLPAWTRDAVPGSRGAWAPDIAFFNDRFHLYYSVSTFGSQRSCIGLATSPTLDPSRPDYRWEDRGEVIDSRPGRDDFNAIDPDVVIDAAGVPWLAFGSFWGGLKLVRLDPATGLRDTSHPEVHALAARPDTKAIEAADLVRRGEFYYLFASIDRCCRGAASDYKIVVGRSKEITGPYLDAEGRPMLEGGATLLLAGAGDVHGPGHSATLFGARGGDWIAHHAYLGPRGVPTLQIRPLKWTADGWPKVGEPLPEGSRE